MDSSANALIYVRLDSSRCASLTKLICGYDPYRSHCPSELAS